MKCYQWLILGLLLCTLFSCQPQNENINISKASLLHLPFVETQDEIITFIYQYNKQRSNLEWTAIQVEKSTGNELKDALSALLQDFRKSGICKGLRLENLTRDANQSIIHLSGKAIIKNKQDSTIFWSALDLTTNRYTKSEGYKLAFN
ncbi:MAG: hypothetical protein ACJATF_004006 [Flavobacteriales bacterium]|jgi:hypothetical protein